MRPVDSRTCWTPWSVFQDGTGRAPTQFTAIPARGTWRPPPEQVVRSGGIPERPAQVRPSAEAPKAARALGSSLLGNPGEGHHRQRPACDTYCGQDVGPGARRTPRGGNDATRPNPKASSIFDSPPACISQWFHVLLTLSPKFCFNFPSRYLSTIGLVVIFSLRSSLRPALGCTLKQPDSKEGSVPQEPGHVDKHQIHGPATLHGAATHGDLVDSTGRVQEPSLTQHPSVRARHDT